MKSPNSMHFFFIGNSRLYRAINVCVIDHYVYPYPRRVYLTLPNIVSLFVVHSAFASFNSIFQMFSLESRYVKKKKNGKKTEKQICTRVVLLYPLFFRMMWFFPYSCELMQFFFYNY